MQDRRGDAPDRRTVQAHRVESDADAESYRDIDEKHDREIALIEQVDALEDAQRSLAPSSRRPNDSNELAPEHVARRQQEERQKQT